MVTPSKPKRTGMRPGGNKQAGETDHPKRKNLPGVSTGRSAVNRTAKPVKGPKALTEARMLLVFARTWAEAEQVARERDLDDPKTWIHVTRIEHVEVRHPRKIDVYVVPGFHEASPEALSFFKALRQRFKAYGIEIPQDIWPAIQVH